MNSLPFFRFHALLQHNANNGLVLYHQPAESAHERDIANSQIAAIKFWQHKVQAALESAAAANTSDDASSLYGSFHQPTYVRLDDELIDDQEHLASLAADLSQLDEITIIDLGPDAYKLSDPINRLAHYLHDAILTQVRVVKLHIGELCDRNKIRSHFAERPPSPVIHICQATNSSDEIQDNLFSFYTDGVRIDFRVTTNLGRYESDILSSSADMTTRGVHDNLAARDAACKLFGIEMTDYQSMIKHYELSPTTVRGALEHRLGSKSCQLNCQDHANETPEYMDFKLLDQVLAEQNSSLRCVRCPAEYSEGKCLYARAWAREPELSPDALERNTLQLFTIAESILLTFAAIFMLFRLVRYGVSNQFHLALALVLLALSCVRALELELGDLGEQIVVALLVAAILQLATVESQEASVATARQAALTCLIMLASTAAVYLAQKYPAEGMVSRISFVVLLSVVQYVATLVLVTGRSVFGPAESPSWTAQVATGLKKLVGFLVDQFVKKLFDFLVGLIFKNSSWCLVVTGVTTVWLNRASSTIFGPFAASYVLACLFSKPCKRGAIVEQPPEIVVPTHRRSLPTKSSTI